MSTEKNRTVSYKKNILSVHFKNSRKNIPENWFEHFQHLALGFMPHGSASIDSGNWIRSFGLSHICLAGLCMNWDSFVILGNIIFVQTNPRIIKEIIIHTKDISLTHFAHDCSSSKVGLI